MKDQIDCRFQSGEYLRFSLFKEGRPLSPMAGNFMYVREELLDRLCLPSWKRRPRAHHAEPQLRFQA